MANLADTDAVIVELYDNPLTARLGDRYGKVVNIASVNEETLIKRAVENGVNINAVVMKAACDAIRREALRAIIRGELVTYGLGHFALDVEGIFIGDAPQWDPKVNRLVARIAPVKELREALKSTPVRVLGMAPDGNVIASVTDITTNKVNEELTPGGMATIKGARIKIAGDQSGVGLWLTNQDSQEVEEVPATSIGVNDPSKVIFVVPPIRPGSYILSIVTQFTGNKLLNNPRTLVLNYVLVVN
jgi:hypothetical protein